MKLDRDLPKNVHDFVDQISNTKSHIFFRRVHEECGIEVKENKKSLYELPSREQMDSFYLVINNSIHKLMFEFLVGTGF